jgi:HEAT repeat protein
MRATPWSVLLVIMVVSGAQALDKAGSPAATAKVRDEVLQTALAKLQGDEASIRQAFSTLSELGGDAAAEAVVARLRRGLPPQLIEAAIDDLVLLNRPVVGAALLELTQHRRIQIRIKAMQALGALKQHSAQAALLYALDDPSSDVRSAAVDALSAVGNARALPALLTAAERNVPGAWSAIGNLASAADVKTVLAHAQDGDLMPIRPALDALVTRKDLPLDARVRLVQQLVALGSPSARACLSDWTAKAMSDQPAKLKQAMADGLARLEREHAFETGVASSAGSHPKPVAGAPAKATDVKQAKRAAGLPVPRPNAESHAAALASPGPTVSSSAPQGGK